jgi:hypothetical protein
VREADALLKGVSIKLQLPKIQDSSKFHDLGICLMHKLICWVSKYSDSLCVVSQVVGYSD